jgi:hypothetical protein
MTFVPLGASGFAHSQRAHHEPTGALQQARRIRQRRAVKERHVYVRGEHVDVAEGRISQTGNRTAVMQKLPDFVPAFSHYLKPLTRDGSQSTCMLFHPGVNGGIPLDSAVESQQFRSHRCSTFFFRDLWLRSALTCAPAKSLVWNSCPRRRSVAPCQHSSLYIARIVRDRLVGNPDLGELMPVPIDELVVIRAVTIPLAMLQLPSPNPIRG